MKLVKQALKVIQTIQQPDGMYAIWFARPKSLASFQIVQRLKKINNSYKTIIDGGANIGQFARAAHRAYPDAKIYSFEPSPEIGQIFQRNLSDVANVELISKALGSQPGQLEFYVNSDSQTSSALKIKETALHHQIEEMQSTIVPVTTLDEFAQERLLEPPILLKLDLQGYELEALRGAANFLSRTTHVLLEAVFEEQYEGEPLFAELIAEMKESNFDFYRPLAFVLDQTNQVAQMDALFTNLNG